MIGHQRDILAALGIDIWIPKDALCQKMPSSSIWRDQAAVEDITEIIVPKAVALPAVEVQFKAEPTQTVAPVVSLAQPIELQAEPLANVLEPQVVQVAAFQLQAFALPHCVIVVDATSMSSEQQQLWNNIQHAISAEYALLQWPFPLLEFQDGRGAESYVQGFLDALSVDKNILFLGQSGYFKHAKGMQLASLQEMLDQPLLKKRLWQFMQKSNHSTDAI